MIENFRKTFHHMLAVVIEPVNNFNYCHGIFGKNGFGDVKEDLPINSAQYIQYRIRIDASCST